MDSQVVTEMKPILGNLSKRDIGTLVNLAVIKGFLVLDRADDEGNPYKIIKARYTESMERIVGVLGCNTAFLRNDPLPEKNPDIRDLKLVYLKYPN